MSYGPLKFEIQSNYQSNILSKTIDFKDGESLANSTTDGPNYWKTKYHFLTPDPIKEPSTSSIQTNGVAKPNVQNSPSKLTLVTKVATNSNDDPNIKPKFRIDSGDSIALEWRKINRIGGGLQNLGNTCFMNSVLQCLTYCPPLMNHLVFDNDHMPTCRLAFCMACELAKHAKRAYESSGSVVKPLFIAQRLKAVAKHFCLGRQEDAHEYLRYLMDHMSKSYVNLYEQRHQNIKLDIQSKQTTLIHEIFGGYHRSRVQSLECKSNSDTFDYFMDFMLDIKSASSLEKALEKYIQPEILQQDNAYKCPKCKKKVAARKQFTVYRAPRVATFQLKRFDFSRMFGGKINKPVQYPETLNLRPYMSTKNGPAVLYKLFGVLVHLGGSCNSGHYYCYVRNSNGYWYQMDDARVSSASPNVVLNQSAYILFYCRKSDAQSLASPRINGSLSMKPDFSKQQNGENQKKVDVAHVVKKNGEAVKKIEVFKEIDIFSPGSIGPKLPSDKNGSNKLEVNIFKSPAPPLNSLQKKIQINEIKTSPEKPEIEPKSTLGLFKTLQNQPKIEEQKLKVNGTSATCRPSLAESSLESLGEKVQTWNGESNSIDGVVKKEKRLASEMSEDDYDEEFDRGKVKKVKKPKLSHQMMGGFNRNRNPFQHHHQKNGFHGGKKNKRFQNRNSHHHHHKHDKNRHGRNNFYRD